MIRKIITVLTFCIILAATLSLPQARASFQVRLVEKKLEKLGFEPGPIDGIWGSGTRSALQDFQRSQGLEVTGRLNSETKSALGLAGSSRGIEVVGVKTDSGDQFDLYEQSYALLIGVSNYSKGWPSLNQVPSEVKKVKKTLVKRGFQVEECMNPDEQELMNVFNRFIDNYGYNKKNRLLFYYAGHGYTMDNGKKGYLVPTNAPNPRESNIDFKRKALNMAQIISWCKQMEAKHALFLFDSCFSGTIFKMRKLPDKPPQINNMISKPVRQFITAGAAGQSVPSDSTFTPVFIDALKYGLGDLNNDGYISGTELGLYLQNEVSRHTHQTPQYGKITDYELSRGDFIFLADVNTEVSKSQKIHNPPSSKSTKENNVQASKEKQSDVGLMVHSQPKGAKWHLDGKYVGRTPDSKKDINQGSHLIKVVKKGYKDWTKRIWIGAQDQIRVDADLQPSMQAPKAGQIWIEPITGMEFVWVPGGCFKMGSPLTKLPEETSLKSKPLWYRLAAGISCVFPVGCAGKKTISFREKHGFSKDEAPAHKVCVDGFWMGRYEVTIGQYLEFLEATENEHGICDWNKFGDTLDCPLQKKNGEYVLSGSRFGQQKNQPMIFVSWHAANSFADWLSRHTGKNFRLPTEAEWEYAARSGGMMESYSGGEDLDHLACYSKNSETPVEYPGKLYFKTTTREVGSKTPNGLGLYDMTGNVWEWCQDWYNAQYYARSPKNNPQGPSSGSYRVIRGGSCNSEQWELRTTNRNKASPDKCSGGFFSSAYGFGFRLCISK